MADAIPDPHRAARTGFPEVVYAPGKTPDQCVRIVERLLEVPGPVLVSRADRSVVDAVAASGLPPVDLLAGDPARGRATCVWRPAAGVERPRVGILTAGTSDLPVADECAATLTACGVGSEIVADIGVAGLHRLLDRLELISGFDLLVVVAGMEGALVSVLAGLIDTPMVAVPTSAGYGSSFEGLTALMAMTASCAPGPTMVGIDNGIGAAAAVVRLARLLRTEPVG